VVFTHKKRFIYGDDLVTSESSQIKKIFLPYKCHCEVFFAEAISCFTGYFTQKEIAAPPKKGGSQ